QLIVGLDRHKTHPRPSYGLGTSFCIDVVVLVGLHVRLHILSRDQTHIMPLLAQSAAQKVSSSTGLHTDQGNMQVRREAQNLIPRALLAHHYLPARVKNNQMKDRLPKINADRVNLHGTPPVYTSTP